jgi:hypothetical protein
MQVLPHGLPMVHCGPLVVPDLLLKQWLMNCLRALPVIPLA